MKPKNFMEKGSVRFHKVGTTEFWLTPINRVFLKVGEQIIFPHLNGTLRVSYDDRSYQPPADVAAEVLRILRKQRHVREFMQVPPHEDEVAFQYN